MLAFLLQYLQSVCRAIREYLAVRRPAVNGCLNSIRCAYVAYLILFVFNLKCNLYVIVYIHTCTELVDRLTKNQHCLYNQACTFLFSVYCALKQTRRLQYTLPYLWGLTIKTT